MEYYVRNVQVNSDDPLYGFCSGICTAANKLYNAALFVERQVYTGIGKKPEELDERQKAVLDSIRDSLGKMNETVRDETQKSRYKMPTPEHPFLNYEFMRAYMQVTENPKYKDTRMTRDTAKNVLKEVSGACFSYLRALRSYGKNPDEFTGKPELPHYLKKQGMHTASLSTNDCVLTTIEALSKSEKEIMKRASTGTPHRDAMSVKHESTVVYFCRTELCCDIGDLRGSKDSEGQEDLDQFRRVTEVKIEPCTGCFQIHVHMIPDKEKHSASERSEIKANEDAEWAALEERCSKTPVRACSIDFGVENLMAITNNVGAPCVLVKGGFVKSNNKYYNDKLAELRSKLDKEKNQKTTPTENTPEKEQSNEFGEVSNENCGKAELSQNVSASTSNKSKRVRKPDYSNLPIDIQIQHLCMHRENVLKDCFNKYADAIISWCKELKFDAIVIGKNDGWKQKMNMGPINNQKFAYIPFYKLIENLRYRAKREGIYLFEQEESYTSLASFLDNDLIPTYRKGDTTVYKFSGVRGPTVNADGMKKPKKANGKGDPRYRGLYRASDGRTINADLNASANIGRKALPRMFLDGQMPDFNKVIIIRKPEDAKETLLPPKQSDTKTALV